MNAETKEQAVLRGTAHADELLDNLLRKSLRDMEKSDSWEATVTVTVEIKELSGGALEVKAKGQSSVPMKHKDETTPEKIGGAQMEIDFDEQVKGAVKNAVKRANRKAGAK